MTASLSSRAVTVLAVVALATCGGPDEAVRGFDVRAEYATVTAARARLAAARSQLDRAQAGRSEAVAAARAAFDEAYADNQRALARFLSVALNVAPGRPETRQALDSFAGDAVANARYVLDHGADPGQVLEALTRAERAYRLLGLGVPRDLGAVLEEIRRQPQIRPTPSPPPPTAAPEPRSRRHPHRR